MTTATDSQRCIACGTAFRCGMGQDTPCWCSIEFAPLLPLPDADGGCYCRDCLAALIAARQEKQVI